MARSGLVDIEETSFEKDGKRIAFRKVWSLIDPADSEAAGRVTIREDIAAPPGSRGGRAPNKTRGKTKPKSSAQRAPDPAVSSTAGALKAWRLAEAKKRSIPAFRILSDKSMAAIADDLPSNEAELLEVAGIGPKLVEKYGAQILRIVAASQR
jgi:DNA topoisomerase-3